MKRAALLTLILLFALILRFYRLDTTPPLFHTSSYLPRLITAVASLLSVFLCYKLSVHYTGRTKIGLLSAFIMVILPWTLEESRVYSSVNNGLSVILTGIYLGTKSRAKWFFLFLAVITFIVFLFVYPDIWFLKNFQIISLMSIRDNVFRLLSPQMWFFNNITFYHGGLREWGMVYISLLPFLIYGMFKSVTKTFPKEFIFLGALIVFASLSPFFPESREFFLVTPLLSFFIGYGFYELISEKKNVYRLITIMLIFFIVYEISQLLHFYFIHYPINVRESADKIYEPF